jgi:hypothetical protein
MAICIGDRVQTNFSGWITDHVVVALRGGTISQSGVMVQVHPPVPKSGGASAWIDVGWFKAKGRGNGA